MLRNHSNFKSKVPRLEVVDGVAQLPEHAEPDWYEDDNGQPRTLITIGEAEIVGVPCHPMPGGTYALDGIVAIKVARIYRLMAEWGGLLTDYDSWPDDMSND